MENWEVAAALERMAGLLALKGENDYKVRAYSHAARQVIRCTEPLSKLIAAGRLRQLPGIGEALEAKIEELVSTGRSSFLARLEAEVPSELLALFSIPGIGFKTAATLVQGLQLGNLAQLEEAVRDGRVEQLPGLGPAVARSILRFFDERRAGPARFHRGVAVPLAEKTVAFIKKLSGVKKVEAAGAYRRGVEMVAEMPLLVALDEPAAGAKIKEALWDLPGLTALVPAGEDIILENVTGLPVRLIFTAKAAFPTSLAALTGSQQHWAGLVESARQSGFTLTGGGLWQNGSALRLEDERALYRALKLEYVPPELREGAGELAEAAAGKLPPLLEQKQIRGDLHLHSDWSDGSASIEALVQEADALGYEYMAVTDHSPSLKIAGGLAVERLLEQIEAIRRLNEAKSGGCVILAGAEVDILPDGSLDLPDWILERLDVVIASVHSHFRQDRETMTSRICRAMEHPLVHMIGHPTGRLLGSRGGYEIDVEKLINCAAATGTIFEINSSPQRLDLPAAYLRPARDAGVKICVNTDAHSTVTMADMSFGVTAARRGRLAAGDLINTLPLAELRAVLQQKRRRER